MHDLEILVIKRKYVRDLKINSTEPGYLHIFVPVGITYSYVCGSMKSCWIGSPNGFGSSDESVRPSSSTINDNYVDDISLTCRSSSKNTHMWTFITNLRYPHKVPGYVGANYSCLPGLNTKD